MKRKLDLWKKGYINDLLLEGKCIQDHLTKSKRCHNKATIVKTFQRLMCTGKVNKALRLLSSFTTGGVLGLDDVITDSSNAWRKICSNFKSSKDLCSALASVGKHLCTASINPDHLSAFVACRLIPLDKCPGVRPIGIGEVHRRTIAKAILSLLKYDIMDTAGSLQVCASQESGCEAAIHAMHQTFAIEKTEGALLVDATNNQQTSGITQHQCNLSIPRPSSIENQSAV